MLTACLSLVLLIVVAHAPLHRLSPRVGWLTTHMNERILLRVTEIQENRDQEQSPQDDAVPATDVGLSPHDLPEPIGVNDTGDIDDASVQRPELTKLGGREILNFAQYRPRIMGGLGNYYLNIDYPEEAREAGIQGRLLLSFVVETTGRATEIRVEESLHPLCDSAAVAALERSRFIAGMQDGRKVPVRMRLPVLFQLVDVPDEPVLADSQK